jgi:hypothetical protein
MKEVFCLTVIDREGGEYQRLIFSTYWKRAKAIKELISFGISTHKMHYFDISIDPELHKDNYKYLD